MLKAVAIFINSNGTVDSLNGLTGNLSLTSLDGTITIAPSGTTIDLSAVAGAGPFLKLDQTTHQNIINGAPDFQGGVDGYSLNVPRNRIISFGRDYTDPFANIDGQIFSDFGSVNGDPATANMYVQGPFGWLVMHGNNGVLTTDPFWHGANINPTIANSQSIGNTNAYYGVSTQRLANLTTNGFVKTGSGTGFLSVDTNSYLTTALTNTHLFVGNGSNIATDVAASGDLTLANTGAFTFNTVNANVGSFGSATQVATFTVNAKGLTTAAGNTSIQIAESQVTNLTTDLATFLKKDGSVALTANWPAGAFQITAANFVSTIATGTKPYACSSITLNDNLNADYLNGVHGKWTSLANTNVIVYSSADNALVNLANPAKFTNTLKSVAGVTQWVIDAAVIAPTWNSVLTNNRSSAGVNPQLTTTDHLEFRDANKYIYSDASTSLTIVSDGTITLSPTTTTNTAKQIVSSLATGTSPFSVTSTTKNTNLNADKTDGIDIGTMTANKMLYTDSASVLSASMVTYNTALASRTPVLNLAPSSSSIGALALTGTASDTSSDTEGIFFSLSHNAGGNRQLQFFPTDAAGTDASFRIYFVGGGMGIDAVTANASTRLDLFMGTNTTSVYFGDATGFFGPAGQIGGTKLTLSPAGSGIFIKEGSNATMGVATLVGGTVVVNTNKVTANSRIFITAQSLGTVTLGQGLAISARSVGTSFTILSQSAVDTSVVAWHILEPA